MKDVLEKLWDETARVERVIFLAGAMAASDAFPSDLEDFFDDEDIKDIEKCLGKIPEYVDIEARGYGRSEDIFEWLRDVGKTGFLVKFATPVMTPTGDESRSFSWGYYATTWIYADTMEQAIDLGMKWVKGRRRAENRQAKSKKCGEQ